MAIGTVPTLVIATGGPLVNVGSVYVLQGGDTGLNEKGAFYHLLADAGGSIAVTVSTTVVEATGIRIVDPITAGLIAVVVTWSAVKNCAVAALSSSTGRRSIRAKCATLSERSTA